MSDCLAKTLDPLILPLAGECLIEASAGTGKTFTITILYLRLLLGLGGTAAFSRPLTVAEILVVTFTEAATEELRGRIRDAIHTLRLACVRAKSEDPLFALLLKEIEDVKSAALQLLAAERQMDEAAIYTIHGFCQRMLAYNACESGILFEQTLIKNELPLWQQACADFWRRCCYPLPLSAARAVLQEWASPEALLADISPFLQGDMPKLLSPPSEDETLLMRHEQIIARIEGLKALWRTAEHELESLISASTVDKRSYSSKNLPNWLSEVGKWACQETQDYFLPKALEKFRQTVLDEKTKKGQAPTHALFSAIDALFAAPLTLRDLIITQALQDIRSSIAQEKHQRAEQGFDDLLSRLDCALMAERGDNLAQSIRMRYPVAMIDEFQDTDPQQYRIFRQIYINQPESGLLLIGDPKQAIYAFRGADIFTYIAARCEVKAHYTLETNWRSSPAMVASVNRLFQQVANPFLFEQIPFIEVTAATKNHQYAFEYQKNAQPAMHFWLQAGEGVSVNDYQQLMAQQCAAQICHWLQAAWQGEAWLINESGRQGLVAGDIAVLVRNRLEAALVRDALNQQGIASVYCSNRDSVFSTPEAKDILWLLQAVLAPEKESRLRCALATALFGLDAAQLDMLNNSEQAWDQVVAEFDYYRSHWHNKGVMPMIREVMKRRKLAENILASQNGERRLTDILHLSELLQEASVMLDSEYALVRWLAQQIAQPNYQADNQQMRLESDSHLVQIVTIHKSKGLEYPLICLPFISHFRAQQQALYHDRQDFSLFWDLDANEQTRAWAEEERLAEDLRLLYVALTRAKYHCSIGIAPLMQGGRKKQGNSDLHQSALGYLVQAGQAGDAQYLKMCLEQLADENIIFSQLDSPMAAERFCLPAHNHALAARYFSRQIKDLWRVTSYSAMQQHNSSVLQDWLPRLDIEVIDEALPVKQLCLTPHTFPKGAAAGTFLHGIFETIDFTQKIDEVWLNEYLSKQGFDEKWQCVLPVWIQSVLTAPLDNSGLQLAKLAGADKQVELQFYLPIGGPLIASQFDALAKRYDALSAQCQALNFNQVQGMLKGFIDLVFRWQGKYYLLDYKSNWLGNDAAAYTQSAMESAMIEHRYDLQYQIYTLALHRYLRHRLANYSYQHHFGGVFYLFLRGIDAQYPGNGIFMHYPDIRLVEGLDSLFGGKEYALEDQQVC